MTGAPVRSLGLLAVSLVCCGWALLVLSQAVTRRTALPDGFV